MELIPWGGNNDDDDTFESLVNAYGDSQCKFAGITKPDTDGNASIGLSSRRHTIAPRGLSEESWILS
jgi:hypothetical protein